MFRVLLVNHLKRQKEDGGKGNQQTPPLSCSFAEHAHDTGEIAHIERTPQAGNGVNSWTSHFDSQNSAVANKEPRSLPPFAVRTTVFKPSRQKYGSQHHHSFILRVHGSACWHFYIDTGVKSSLLPSPSGEGSGVR